MNYILKITYLYAHDLNHAPIVETFSDTNEVTISSGPFQIYGSVTDDGLPDPPAAATTLWSQVTGSGTVAFDDSTALNTTVTFSDTGACCSGTVLSGCLSHANTKTIVDIIRNTISFLLHSFIIIF